MGSFHIRRTTVNQNAALVAQKFHRLTEIAIKNGGLWCFSGKDTEKSVAKIISAETEIPFRHVIEALTLTRPNWHDEIQFRMKRTKVIYDHDIGYWRYRFHIDDLARVAAH